MTGRLTVALVVLGALTAGPAGAASDLYTVPQEGGFYDIATIFTGPCEPAQTLPPPQRGDQRADSTWVESEFMSEPEVEPWGTIAPTTTTDEEPFPQSMNPRGPCVGDRAPQLDPPDYVSPLAADHFLPGPNVMRTYRVFSNSGVCHAETSEEDISPGANWCVDGTGTHTLLKTTTFEVYWHCLYTVVRTGRGATVRRMKRNGRLGPAQPLRVNTVLYGGDVMTEPGRDTVVLSSGGVDMWLTRGRFEMKRISNCRLSSFSTLRPRRKQPPPIPPVVRDGKVRATFKEWPKFRFLVRTPEGGIRTMAGTSPRQAPGTGVKEFTVSRDSGTRTTRVCTTGGRVEVTTGAGKRRSMVVGSGDCAVVKAGRPPRSAR